MTKLAKNASATLIALPHPDDRGGATATMVGECVDERHPTLVGRVQVRVRARGGSELWWVATLRGLAVREGDRVLIVQPANWDEPIVTGVIDGFSRRQRPSREHAATLDLRPDEAVCIRSSRGEGLIELTSTERGAEIRLMQPDVALEIDGKLEIGAKQITLRAREGEARIEASDDVIVDGETIHLN